LAFQVKRQFFPLVDQFYQPAMRSIPRRVNDSTYKHLVPGPELARIFY
jgi:hypothetical protein